MSHIPIFGTPVEIPLSPQPQNFSIVLSGVEYHLTFKWNDADLGGWTMDIAGADNGPTIIAGIPLITGADLLAQYRHLGIKGALIVQTDNSRDLTPTFDDLGQESHLYYLPIIGYEPALPGFQP